jgi:hypothetical protein
MRRLKHRRRQNTFAVVVLELRKGAPSSCRWFGATGGFSFFGAASCSAMRDGIFVGLAGSSVLDLHCTSKDFEEPAFVRENSMREWEQVGAQRLLVKSHVYAPKVPRHFYDGSSLPKRLSPPSLWAFITFGAHCLGLPGGSSATATSRSI